MEKKPLSKEDRAELAAYAKAPFVELSIDEMAKITRLLAVLYSAEQFWRESIKRHLCHPNERGRCEWCDQIDCRPDCPWLLAQD